MEPAPLSADRRSCLRILYAIAHVDHCASVVVCVHALIMPVYKLQTIIQ